MNLLVQSKNLLRTMLLLALVGASLWAWQSAGGTFANLWLTSDQQVARLMARQQYAEARRQRLEPAKDDAGGTGGQLEADAIVFDDRPRKSGDTQQVEVVTGGALNDAQLQAPWLRRVQTRPADFLRAKFAYRLSRRPQEKPQS